MTKTIQMRTTTNPASDTPPRVGPWDDEFEFMMVYNSEHQACKPRPAWFPPPDELLELNMKYNQVYNMLEISSNRENQGSHQIQWGLFTTAGKSHFNPIMQLSSN